MLATEAWVTNPGLVRTDMYRWQIVARSDSSQVGW